MLKLNKLTSLRAKTNILLFGNCKLVHIIDKYPKYYGLVLETQSQLNLRKSDLDYDDDFYANPAKNKYYIVSHYASSLKPIKLGNTKGLLILNFVHPMYSRMSSKRGYKSLKNKNLKIGHYYDIKCQGLPIYLKDNQTGLTFLAHNKSFYNVCDDTFGIYINIDHEKGLQPYEIKTLKKNKDKFKKLIHRLEYMKSTVQKDKKTGNHQRELYHIGRYAHILSNYCEMTPAMFSYPFRGNLTIDSWRDLDDHYDSTGVGNDFSRIVQLASKFSGVPIKYLRIFDPLKSSKHFTNQEVNKIMQHDEKVSRILNSFDISRDGTPIKSRTFITVIDKMIKKLKNHDFH